VQVYQINLSGIVERYIVSKTSNFNKRTHPNEHWVQAVNEMGVGRGEEVCRKGCPYIRQLANCTSRLTSQCEDT